MGNISTITKYVRGLINDQLQKDGRDMWEYKLDTTFRLSQTFIVESSIKVYRNGTLITGWNYDSDINAVIITGTLVAGDNILILYSYYRKYSDLEIAGYIESSLTYFSEYRYTKSFISDGVDILVELATGSTDSPLPVGTELKFIAKITGILINPDNRTIRTDTMTVTPANNKSQEDLIADAFGRFLRFVGNIEEFIDPDLMGFDYTENCGV